MLVSHAESTSEEPGDEDSDGSDEEPAVGRQRHADAQEMILLHAGPPSLRVTFLLRCTDWVNNGVSLGNGCGPDS